MIELAELIRHPEQLDRDTLYELRSMLALHPYYQVARLVMLHNLYLLHDPTFDEELRKAAFYVTDRRKLFNMVEAAHYQLQGKKESKITAQQPNRTVALIDDFLDSIPEEDKEEQEGKPKRKPTPADAAIDYVAYLLATEEDAPPAEANTQQKMKGQDLIDTFLEQEKGRMVLNELPQMVNDDAEEEPSGDEENEEEYFTETLARIYIKQGRYQKALDIIGRLHERFPHKNAYFADQMRFLEKLIINNSNNNNKK